VATDKRVDFRYNAIGQFDTISRYSDLAGTQLVIRTDYAYDDIEQLIGIQHGNASGTTVAFYEFVYDSAGRLLAQTDIDGQTIYSYDSRDQLTAALRETADSRGDEGYTYDANGNRVESHRHVSAYMTGPGNQLLSDGVHTHDYDAEGNMIRRTEIATGAYRTFEWDHRNRLTRVVDATAGGTNVQDVSYGYDVLGRRIALTTDADGAGPEAPFAEYYVYDGAHIALEFVDADASGMAEQPTLRRRNLFGPGVDHILAQETVDLAQTQWMLPDHQGSVRDIVDDDGNVVNHVLYDSFGNLVAQTNPGEATRYGFAAREFDAATGLQYLRARHYDPAIGRFISRDPFGNIDGPNHYAFVGNQPATQVDRSGLNGQDINRDVNMILSVFRLVVETLTQTGMRLEDSPSLNNFMSTLQRLDPEVRDNFVVPTMLENIRHMGETHRLLGCGEQAGLLVNELEAIASLLDGIWVFNVTSGFTPLPHQWAELRTVNDPNSPIIMADPWSGRIEIRWPTHTQVEQFNGSGWDGRLEEN
jgi:RHS repeat-associated protein